MTRLATIADSHGERVAIVLEDGRASLAAGEGHQAAASTLLVLHVTLQSVKRTSCTTS